jgi:hypothetical protein
MKVTLKTYGLLNLWTLLVTLSLAFILFNSNLISPDYYVCSRIVEQSFTFLNESVSFNFPYSCDENEYFLGFQDFKFIVFNDHSYQQRPLYIFIVYFLNEILTPIFNLLGMDEKLGIYFSVITVHSIFLNISLYLILKIISINKITHFDIFFITILNILQPMAKWGIFGPSVQMLSLLTMVLPIYISKKDGTLSLKSSFIFGVLFMYNRATLVSFVIYLFFMFLKNREFNFYKNVLNSFSFFIPFAVYRLFFAINNLTIFDTNTQTYQQFSWIIDYFTGGNRKFGEYYCHRIPGFIKCYFDGTLNLFSYLIIPLFISLICYVYLFRKNKNLFYLISITTIVIYSFWSLIGWYPLRFIYYSIGNTINVLIIIGFFKLNKSNYAKILYSIPLIIYLTFLTMWNNPNPNNFIDLDLIIISALSLIIYLVFNNKFLLKQLKL